MTGFGEIIEGYGELAEWFVKESTAEARRTASHIDAGTLDADAAASAAVRAVNLGLLGLFGLAGSIAGAQSLGAARSALRPLQFQDKLATEQRTLDPVTLTNAFGDSFGAHARPNVLSVGETDFDLVADIDHIPRAGRYIGQLNVRTSSGQRPIDVTWRVS